MTFLLHLDWDKLRIFHAVSEAGSFTHAGEILNLSQSAVSRQISGLEESLNIALFHRHARGLRLTEQGETLYRTVREVFAKLAMVEARLSEYKERPTGELKITCTVAFGSIWLAPRMKEFMEAYPDITVSLMLADTALDLSMREADVAIRMTPPRHADLIQRRLFTVHHHIYASPSYIAAHGLPNSVADLDQHPLIIYGEESLPPTPDINWLANIERKSHMPRMAILTINNIFAIMSTVKAGLGLASLPEYVAQGQDNLVCVLPEIQGPPVETYFVYPEESRHSKRIAVFRDFLLQKIATCNF